MVATNAQVRTLFNAISRIRFGKGFNSLTAKQARLVRDKSLIATRK